MKRSIISIVALILLAAGAHAQKSGASPTETGINFYRALKEKRYVEGFRHSVCRNAVEGLTTAELRDLEPYFARTFPTVPDNLEPKDEKITGDTATVSLTFIGTEEPQQVALIRVGGEWLVGDQETFALVKSQGRAFFFNTRMMVNEGEAHLMLQAIIGAEILYSRKYEGKMLPLQELIRVGGVPKDIQDSDSRGYKIGMTVSGDGKSFFATATPTIYGKTGKVSFYADITGVRGEDLKGHLATAKSPIYRAK